MSTPKTYYVKGRFEGHFKTNQRSFLKSDEPFPKGDEHKVQIYRGIVSQSEEINQQEFDALNGFYNFREIQNVQVNTSNHWPVPNDRIFSLSNAKLVNVKVSNVQQVGEQTLGEIHADVISEVIDGKYNHQRKKEKNNDDNNDDNNGGGKNQDNDQDGSDNSETTQDDNDDNGGGTQTPPRKGCADWFPNFNWLRWLLYLLLILLLLYILGRCTQFTQKIYCKIADYRVTNEQKIVKQQIDSLMHKIELTTFKIESCGLTKNQDGTNIPYSKLVNLGENSGVVTVDFNANDVPDRLEVIYDGKIVVESKQFVFENYKRDNFNYLKKYGGFTQKHQYFFFNYQFDKNKPTEVLVRVIPNRSWPTTKWDLVVSCPQ
jgi:hypothetical protein